MLGDQGRLGPGLLLCSGDGWVGGVGWGGGQAGGAWNGSSKANISRSKHVATLGKFPRGCRDLSNEKQTGYSPPTHHSYHWGSDTYL